MARQTLEFLRERTKPRSDLSMYPADVAAYLSPLAVHSDSAALVKVSSFDLSAGIQDTIDELLAEVRGLSLILDFPLNCREILFLIPPGQTDSGPLWRAVRLPIARGFAFEIDERDIAERKLQIGPTPYNGHANPQLHRAEGYYLAGMKLLALEDETEGLLHAAFMQFYLAAEALLGSEKSSEAAKSFAKRFQTADAVAVQRCIYQVYGVRGRYFGHAKAKAAETAQESFDIAKQVLVARWLARHLVDLCAGRQEFLVREMRLYRELTSVEFRGTEAELRSGFVLPGIADPFSARVFDALGN